MAELRASGDLPTAYGFRVRCTSHTNCVLLRAAGAGHGCTCTTSTSVIQNHVGKVGLDCMQARQQQQQQLQLQDGMTQQAAGQQQGTGQQQALPAGHEPSALADAASSSLAAGSGREQQGDGDAAAVTPAPSSSAPAAASRLLPTVHHMDPYRLGAKADKMAGLIDFESAFRQDVCLIEWPDRMPAGRRAHGGWCQRLAPFGLTWVPLC